MAGTDTAGEEPVPSFAQLIGWGQDYFFVRTYCTLVLLCSPFFGGYLIYLMNQAMDARREYRAAIYATLTDGAFMAEVAHAGYRVEQVEDRGNTWLVARCARANEAGPLPCDPAPSPPGLDRRLWTVVP